MVLGAVVVCSASHIGSLAQTFMEASGHHNRAHSMSRKRIKSNTVDVKLLPRSGDHEQGMR